MTDEAPTFDPFGPARAAGGYVGEFNGEVMPVLTRSRRASGLILSAACLRCAGSPTR